jgi:hypothetical protein
MTPKRIYMDTEIENEVLYFLVTDSHSIAFEKIKFPLERIFVIGSDSLENSNNGESKSSENSVPYSFIQEETPKLIAEKISESIRNSEKEKEKVILVSQNFYNTFENKLELYDLLPVCGKYKNIFLRDFEGKEEENEENFMEIFPERSTVTLLDTSHKFEEN